MEEVVVFNLGKELFGIEIDYVTEIVKKQKIQFIPTENKYLLGAVNIRDKVKNVFDLSKVLEVNKEKEPEEYFIICINKETNREVVFPISDVKSIFKVTNENKVELTNRDFLSKNVKYVIKKDTELVTVLDFKEIVDNL